MKDAIMPAISSRSADSPRASDPAASPLTDEMLARFSARAAKYDREHTFFTEDFDELRQAGYLRLAVPADLGGFGLTLPDVLREQRRLGYHAPATALAVWGRRTRSRPRPRRPTRSSESRTPETTRRRPITHLAPHGPSARSRTGDPASGTGPGGQTRSSSPLHPAAASAVVLTASSSSPRVIATPSPGACRPWMPRRWRRTSARPWRGRGRRRIPGSAA